jgi:hypothetical protein
MTKLRALGILLALVAAPALASADDNEMTLDQVPAKVKATIEMQVGDGKLEDIDKTKIGDKTVFEAEFTDKHDQRFEIVVAEDGKLLGRSLEKQQPKSEPRTEADPQDQPDDEMYPEPQPEPLPEPAPEG